MSKWEILTKGRNKLDKKSPDLDTVQSDNLTAIERFVREIASNADDAKDKTKSMPVNIKFHLLDLDNDKKRNFLDIINFEQLKDSYNHIINANPENYNGKGLVTAGLIINYLVIIFYLLSF